MDFHLRLPFYVSCLLAKCNSPLSVIISFQYYFFFKETVSFCSLYLNYRPLFFEMLLSSSRCFLSKKEVIGDYYININGNKWKLYSQHSLFFLLQQDAVVIKTLPLIFCHCLYKYDNVMIVLYLFIPKTTFNNNNKLGYLEMSLKNIFYFILLF